MIISAVLQPWQPTDRRQLAHSGFFRARSLLCDTRPSPLDVVSLSAQPSHADDAAADDHDDDDDDVQIKKTTIGYNCLLYSVHR